MALGIIPGSDSDVRNNADMVNKNRMAPIMGIAIVIRSAKNGQLELEKYDIPYMLE